MKALIITGKFVQDSEFIYPYYRMKEAGYEIVVATEDGQDTFGVWGTKIPVDTKTNNLDTESYDLLILPGGARALEYIRQDKNALDFIHRFNKKGKLIAAICHGSQLLISAKIIKDKNVSGYYSIKDDIINAGAHFVDQPVVVDGNIITSPHYKYLGDWMRAVFEFFRAGGK